MTTPLPSRTFATTHWSIVIAAGGRTTEGHDSLARLCRTYWYPLYSYVRRRGHSREDAHDLTQEFFARLIEKNWVAQADRTRGRFRTFLLSAMTHFLSDEWDKTRAAKRGGGVPIVALDDATAEARYSTEGREAITPEQAYELRWALALLDEVVARLRAEFARDGRAAWFDALHPCLIGDREAQPYAELAVALGVTEGTVKSAMHRFRRRYRELLREEVAHTVETAGEVDAELRHLLTVLSQ